MRDEVGSSPVDVLCDLGIECATAALERQEVIAVFQLPCLTPDDLTSEIFWGLSLQFLIGKVWFTLGGLGDCGGLPMVVYCT